MKEIRIIVVKYAINVLLDTRSDETGGSLKLKHKHKQFLVSVVANFRSPFI